MKMERVRSDLTQQIDFISNICRTAAWWSPLTLSRNMQLQFTVRLGPLRTHLSLFNHHYRVLFRVPSELFLSTTSRSWLFTHQKHADSEDFQLYADENKSFFAFLENYRPWSNAERHKAGYLLEAPAFNFNWHHVTSRPEQGKSRPDLVPNPSPNPWIWVPTRSCPESESQPSPCAISGAMSWFTSNDKTR